MKTSFTVRIFFLLLSFCLSTASTYAQIITWSGAAMDGNWATGTNWVGGVAPMPAQTARFSGGTVVITAGVPTNLNTLDINGGANVTLNPGVTAMSLTSMSVDAASRLTLGVNLTVSLGMMSTINGILEIRATNAINPGALLNISNGAELVLEGNSSVAATSPMYAAGSKLTYSGSTMKILDMPELTFPAIVPAGVTVTINHTNLQFSVAKTIRGVLRFNHGASITINNPIDVNTQGKVQIDGTPTLLGGSNITYGGSGDTLEFIGSTPTTIDNNGPAMAQEVNGGTMNGTILVNKTGGSVVNSIAGTLRVNGNFRVQQGRWNINALTGGSILELNGAANEIVTGASLVLPNGTATIPPGGTLQVMASRTLFNNGTLSVGAFATVVIEGSAHIYGNNALQYQATTATLRYIGGSAINTTPQVLPAIMPGSVVFQKSLGGANLGASTNVLGAFIVAAQNVDLNGNTLQLSYYGRINPGASVNTDNGVLFVSNGVGVAKLGNLTVGMNGTLRLDGTGYVSDGMPIVYNSSSNLLFTGSGNRTVTNVEMPSGNPPATTLDANLHVNKSPNSFVFLPVPSAANRVELNAAAFLSITSGIIRSGQMGNSVLRVLNTNVNAVTFATTGLGYIDGPLQRTLPNGMNTASFLYPLGKVGTFLPLALRNPDASGSAVVAAEAYNSGSATTPIAPLSYPIAGEYWRIGLPVGGSLNQCQVSVQRASGFPATSSVGMMENMSPPPTPSGNYSFVGGTPIANGLVTNTITNPQTTQHRYFTVGATNLPVKAAFGYQLLFNGSNQTAVSSTSAGLNALSSFTIEALVRPYWITGSPPSNPCIFSIGDGAGTVFSLSMGRLYGTLIAGNNSTTVNNFFLPGFRRNVYYHIAVTYAAGIVTYYIDGKLAGTSNLPLNFTPNTLFYVGSRSGAQDFWNGSIDEVRLWNTVLPHNVIATYRGREADINHPNAANIVHYWRMNNGFSEASQDFPGLNNPLTLVNTPAWIEGSSTATVFATPNATNTGALFATKIGGGGTLTYSAMGVNAGSTMATLTLDNAGNLSYTPTVPVTADARDMLAYRIQDNAGNITTGTLIILFAPVVTISPQFLPHSRPGAMNIVAIQAGTTPFAASWSPPTGLSSTTVLNPTATLATNATYALQLQDAHGFGGTGSVPVQIQPLTLAFSHASSTATVGLPLLINSGNPVIMRYGIFRKRSPFALDTANASVSLHVAPAMGGNAQFSFKYDSTFTNTDRVTASGIVINWLNAPLAGGTTFAVVTLFRTGGAPMDAARVTVQISSNANAPIITSFAPQSAGAGGFVTITGANFANVSAVRFGGIAAQNFVVVSSTEIRAQVGAGATGLVNVTAMAGSGNSLGVFTFAPPPNILNFTPTQGASGATVRITGQNFIQPLVVRFGGVLADSIDVVAPNEVFARVGIGGTGTIAITTPGGTATSANVFTYFGAPFIVNIAPTQGTAGDTLTINGGNFQNLDSIRIGTTTLLNGINANLVLPIQSSRIRIVLSTHALSGAISIFTETGQSASPQVFTYISPPVIDSISPRLGGAGTLLTVHGKNFTQVDSVRFGGASSGALDGASGGVRLNSVNVISSTRLVALMPSGLQNSTAAIVVFARAGRDSSNVPNWFQYAAPPVITGFSPSAAGVGAWVELAGANFFGITSSTQSLQSLQSLQSVQFAGVSADSLRFLSPTSLQARVPTGAQTGRISLTAAGGMATSLTDFRCVQSPTITSFSPQSASSGATIEILGREFINVRRVYISNGAGVEVTLTNVSIPNDMRIVARIPANALSGILTVETSQGTVRSQNTLQILVPAGPPPQITGMSPQAGEAGSEVVLSGANFVNVANITLNGVSMASFRVVSPTLVVAIIPQNASSGTIQLTTPNGTAFSLGRFTVLQSLVNAGLSALQRDSSLLVQFYQTTGGAWLREENWLTKRPLSSWAGVRVDSARVVGLSLANNGIQGNLPSFLAGLTSLRVLNLENNFLEGTIASSIATMRTLEELRLSNNRFSGAIPVLSSMASLRVLALDNNRFVGEFPRGLCDLVGVREISLQNNALSGVIPRCIGNLTRTERLNLGDNLFSGTIPPEISTMTALQELRLARNLLTGSIPAFSLPAFSLPSFSGSTSASGTTSASTASAQAKLSASSIHAVSALRVLDVSNNQLSGNIGASVAGLAHLQTALFQQNTFTGSIPASIGNCAELTTLNMSNNQLSGALPAQMGALQKLTTLLLRGNRFSGALPPELGRMRSLEQVQLDSNALTGLTDSLVHLRALRQLTLSNNAVSRLPQLRALDSLNVAWNRLEFSALDAAQQIRAFVYHPQDSVLTRIDTIIRVFTPFSASSALTLGRHEYQWYRVQNTSAQNTSAQNASTQDVVLFQVQGQNQESLVFERFARGDTGLYTCFVRNSKYPALTLIRRTVRISAFAPRAPQETVRLVAPLNNSQSIPITPVLRWTTLASISGYEIQISTRADFSTLQWSFAVNNPFAASQLVPTSVGLQNLTSYFWRVRAESEGLLGAWSEAFRFTTQPANQPANVESIDFGRVLAGRSSKAEVVRLKNLSTVPIIIQDVQLDSAQILNFQTQRLQSTEATQHFRFAVPPGATRLELDEEMSLPIRFMPTQVGEYRAAVAVRFAPASGGAATTLRFASALIGRGGILLVDSLHFGTMTAGITRTETMRIRNIGLDTVRIQNLTLSSLDTTQATNFVLSETERNLVGMVIRPNDSVLVNLNCRASANAPRGMVRGTATIFTNLDTMYSVPLIVDVRRPSQNDIMVEVLVQPELGNDSIAPGGSVHLALRIKSVQKSTTANVTVNASLLDLYTANVTSRFSGELAFDSSVLVPDESERAIERVVGQTANVNGRILSRYRIPVTAWSPQVIAGVVRDSVLLHIRCRAVSGDTSRTRLRILRLLWDNTSSVNKDAEVIVNYAGDGVFTSAACMAGGVRLTTRAAANDVRIASTTPVSEELRLSYTLREDGAAEIRIVNLLGNVMITRKEADASSGEYEVTLPFHSMPSGAYFVQLITPSGVVVRRFEVVR